MIVVNGAITDPYNWPKKNGLLGLLTVFIGVITPFITSRDPPCSNIVFVGGSIDL